MSLEEEWSLKYLEWSRLYGVGCAGGIQSFLNKRWYKLVFHLAKGTQIRLRGKVILEVGCGTGGFCQYAESEGAEAMGIELSRVAAHVGNQSKMGSYLICTGHNLPFKTGVFDVAVCADVLEHVPSYERVFAEIVRVCRTGGHVIVTAPSRININMFYWPIYFLNSKLGLTPYQPRDINLFTQHTFQLMCKQNKLHLLHQSGLGLIWFPSTGRLLHFIESLDKPRAKLGAFCINIGMVARKP